jgi:outer membrane protein
VRARSDSTLPRPCLETRVRWIARRKPASPRHVLALIDAVDLALCHSPQVQVSWAAIRIQAASLGQAKAAWLPSANATMSHLHNRTEYPASPALDSANNGRTAYVGVTWRLFDFGARAADQAAAARLLDAALANQDATMQKALGAVVQAYFDAVSARSAARSRGEATLYARQTSEAAKRREDKGAGAANDTLQAKAALAKARLAEQRAIGDYQKAMSVLLYACGIAPESVVELAEEPDAVPATAVADLAEWLQATTTRHPAILAAQAQIDAAEAKVRSVRTQGLPSIDFTGNYYRNGYPNQGLQPTRSATTTVGVTLNIPLFSAFGRTYQVRGAQAQVEQSRAQLLDTRLQLASTIVKDHAEAVAALANLDSSAKWEAAATAAVESERRRYDKGAADILERLAAESALTDAAQERVRCMAEWQLARLRLFADSGLLGRKEIEETSTAVTNIDLDQAANSIKK